MDGYECIQFRNTKMCPINYDNCVVVSSFGFSVNRYGEPLQMVLRVSIKMEEAFTDTPEFCVYIPADNVYHAPVHYELLEHFRSGEHFALVKPSNLFVYRRFNDQKECFDYWGRADSIVYIPSKSMGRKKDASKTSKNTQ